MNINSWVYSLVKKLTKHGMMKKCNCEGIMPCSNPTLCNVSCIVTLDGLTSCAAAIALFLLTAPLTCPDKGSADCQPFALPQSCCRRSAVCCSPWVGIQMTMTTKKVVWRPDSLGVDNAQGAGLVESGQVTSLVKQIEQGQAFQ